MAEKNTQKDKKIQDLINGGAEIAGGAIGGALGFLAGGPAGAAIFGAGGSAAILVLKKVGSDISDRFLSHREQVRVGGVLALATREINDRLKNGDKLRTDNFFNANESGRSGAEEILESILLKSQREPQEQKLPYMAHLLASLAFSQDISIEMSHQISKVAEQLTYRQLCLLRLAVIKSSFHLRKSDYRGQESFNKELYQVLYECQDLYLKGLVNFGGSVAFGVTDVIPAQITIQGLGTDIYNLMKLWSIPTEDLEPARKMLE